MGFVNSISPFSGEQQFEPLPESTTQDVAEAVARSVKAGQQWSRLPPKQRASALRAIAKALEKSQHELADLAQSETALGTERLIGEITRACFQMRLFSTGLETGSLLPTEVDEPVGGPPPEGHPLLVRTYRPLGPVAVFGAGNFPFAFGQLGGDTVSALAAGCSVVVKDHPGHPHLANKLMEIASRALHDSGYDSDVLLNVRGMTAGVALIQNPAIKAGAFTGSQMGGRALWDLASKRPEPIPFYGEMGSINPVFISRAALGERGDAIAEQLAAALTLGLGQFCTKPSVVFVVDEEDFLVQLARNIEKSKEGHLLSPASLERFRSAKNRVSAVRGVRKIVAPEESKRDLVVEPGLLGISIGDFLANPGDILEECFGPLGVVVECSEEADFFTVLDKLAGTLVSTVQASPGIDQELVRSLVDKLSDISGRVVINGWPTGLSVTPWQHHGGPYPATTSALHTSVGLQASLRFARPVVLQNATGELWPNLQQ